MTEHRLLRTDDTRRASLVLVAVLVGCAGGAAPGPETISTQSATSEASSEASSSHAVAEVAAPEETSAEEPAPQEPAPQEPEASPEPSPIVFTRVWFDLRSMPHRGPHDVDSRLVSGRVELLAQRARDAAGEPPPRILVFPGASVFRAEFFGSEPEALSQCQRAVEALEDVRTTPCARIEP